VMLAGATARRITITDPALRGVVSYSSRVTIEENTITGSLENGILVGVASTDISDIIIRGNTVDRSALPVTLSEGGIKVHGLLGGNSVSRIQIVENTVVLPVSSTSVNGVCLETWGNCYQATVANNVTYGGSMGVSIDRTTGASVTGNTIRAPWKYGIEVPKSLAVSVAGNSIYGEGIADYGIIIDGTVNVTVDEGAVVVGNTIRNTKLYGIFVTNAMGAAVAGNTVNTLLGTGIYVQYTNNFAVTGNVCKRPTGAFAYGIAVDRCSYGTVSGNHLDGFNQGVGLINTGLAADGVTTGYVLTAIKLGPNCFANAAAANYRCTLSGTGTMANSVSVIGGTVTATTASAYTVDPDEVTVNCTPASGTTQTITLTATPFANQRVTIRKVDAGTGQVAISGTVEGATPSNLTTQYAKVRLEYSGSAWFYL
jgi:hypothetical protein